jgi:hypothetical protein
MLCTAPEVCLAMSQSRGTRMIQDHWTAVKIVLGVYNEMFLDYGGDIEFSVKGYVDASFNTYPNDSE